MDSQEGLLRFMDLLDPDEEIIDTRLKSLMERKVHTNEHLVSAIHLLQYKQLINTQEGTECKNEAEFEFVAKLIEQMNSENISNICKIINIVLRLNTKTIVSKSEHLLQQILSNINLFQDNPTSLSVTEEETLTQAFLSLKLCDSILDAVSKTGEKVSLLFLKVPLENLIFSSWEMLKAHFLTITVPKLFENVTNYFILDKIWVLMKKSSTETEKEAALTTLSSLSDYYIPAPNSKGIILFDSQVISQNEFWSLLLFGLESDDGTIRKHSIYLSKRTIDYVADLNKDVVITIEADLASETIFLWQSSNKKHYKQSWDNFFILIDSLDEKQSNIVLPSLKLFDEVNHVPKCWLHSAFKLGLKHDNTQVKLKCIEYRFKIPLRNINEAQILLEAFNDINLYDNNNESGIKLKDFKQFMEINNNVSNVFKGIAKVKWSPVPLYHITKGLTELKLNLNTVLNNEIICREIHEIFRIPCNNYTLRRHIHGNIGIFMANCINLHWKDLVNIYATVKLKVPFQNIYFNPLEATIKKLKIKHEEDEFLKVISDSYINIDFLMVYLSNNEELIGPFLDIVNNKIMKLEHCVNRQYCDKSESLSDLLYLLYLFNIAKYRLIPCNVDKCQTIEKVITNNYKSLLQYTKSLLSSDFIVNIEDFKLIFDLLGSLSVYDDSKEIKESTLILYKLSLVLLREQCDISKKVLSIFILSTYTNDTAFSKYYMHGMLNVKEVLKTIEKTELEDVNSESSGRMKNIFYEKSCEFLHNALNVKPDASKEYTEDIIDFITSAIDKGGYGCLKWILKIINKILPLILEKDKIKFNIYDFINRVWNEIEELKSNNQYSVCIDEFVRLITQDGLLKRSMYNNIITFYCNKLIEYGPQRSTALFCLVRQLNQIDLKPEYGHIIYVVCEVLLYSPLPRKDQRILENHAIECSSDKFGFHSADNEIHYNFETQYLITNTLSKIDNEEVLQTVTSFIKKRIDDMFKNKTRYHENSQSHRTLLRGLEHFLQICLLHPQTLQEDHLLIWLEDLLAKLPHQPSVRICLEWLISLHYYVKKTPVKSIISSLQAKNIPVISQFTIIYWIVSRRIRRKTCDDDEFCNAMDYFLSLTMGPNFNTRLYAQYLASKLYSLYTTPEIKKKYSYVIDVIKKTLEENRSDKNYIKLKNDKFFDEFDILRNLQPRFYYYILPRYFNHGINEAVNIEMVISMIKVSLKELGLKDLNNEFKQEWSESQAYDENDQSFIVDMDLEGGCGLSDDEEQDTTGTIQKKYIPWRNMTDLEVYDVERKRQSTSELVIVACLIDKLPNLGGLARTSEVFGVKTCVVDSMRLLKQSQFQALSVSAERWVNMEEVRPGAPLKSYLMRMKAEGYSVVAAEQTSSSCQLHQFKFPKKTVLLLGHEKQGVPCDLLPLMDYCVEIPQQGVIRSLNVHVTAAIFIWEYSRQHVL